MPGMAGAATSLASATASDMGPTSLTSPANLSFWKADSARLALAEVCSQFFGSGHEGIVARIVQHVNNACAKR